jgi:hypothetical protein
MHNYYALIIIIKEKAENHLIVVFQIYFFMVSQHGLLLPFSNIVSLALPVINRHAASAVKVKKHSNKSFLSEKL